MSFGKIKRNPTDTVFSEWIRERDGNKCQYPNCNRSKDNGYQMQCAHGFGRRIKATRWRDTNAICLCVTHHQLIDEDPEAKRDLFINRWGENEWKTNRALHDLRTKSKVDEVAMRKEIREKLSNLTD